MNAAIRRIALGLALVFAALLVNLNVVQLVRSDELTNHPQNQRAFLDEVGRRRGEIWAADGTVLAESYRARGDDKYKFRRRYPLGDLFGHITGFYAPDVLCQSAGLEETFDDYLVGDEPFVAENWVDDLLGRQRDGNTLRITIDPDVQELAARALGNAIGDERGAVAAMDVKTGAVLALYATPTYDPNAISRKDPEECGAAYERLQQRPGDPLLGGAFQRRIFPGSTMKILISAAALADGKTPSYPIAYRSVLDLPDTDKVLRNFSPSACGGNLERSLADSCNTAFGWLGMQLGKRKIGEMTERFGFGAPLDFDLPTVASCVVAIPGGGCDSPMSLSRPGVAYSSIGQQSVQVSALQMASVAATVSNGGYVLRPYLVQQILDPAGAILQETDPRRGDPIYGKRVARQLKQMMITVVTNGTGTRVGFADGDEGIIGGKTGTAQSGIPGTPPHVWFVAFSPRVAIAVVVEHGGRDGFDATGGGTAGPVAKAVLERLDRMLARQEAKED